MNKKTIVCLVLAIATVTGTSVMASSAKNKEIDGQINNAISFADEHNYIEGTIGSTDNDNQESGFFYDQELLESTDEDYSMGEKYGSHYMIMDDKLFDLEDGDVVDDDVKDLDYDATKKFKTELKDVSRYAVTDISDITNQERQLKDRFGEVWYKAEVPRSGNKGTSYIFYSEDKGCLDISYKANLYFYDTETSKDVKISEFGDTVDGYTANMTGAKLIAQDSSSLYFLCNVEISKTNGGTDNLKYIIKTNKTTKSDSSVRYPSSIDSYLVSDSSIITASFLKLTSLVGEAKEFTVNSGELQAVSSTGSDIAVSQITLGRGNVTTEVEGSEVNLYIGAIGDSDSLNTSKYSIASDGKVWSIYKGSVMYYEDGEFKDEFDVDTSLDDLDVYDDNNAICWSDSSEVFEVRTGSSDAIENDSISSNNDSTDSDVSSASDLTSIDSEVGSTTAAKDTSVSYQGHWEFGTAKELKWVSIDGKAVVNQWVYSNNGWYYVNDLGVATKDWAQIGNAWYHFDGTNKMQTGWKEINKNWYFFGGNGAMVTGWQSDSGNWYYLNEQNDGYLGKEMSGWITVGNEWYLLASNGVLKTGWTENNGIWFYFNYQGKMLKDCVVDGYYLGLDGSVQAISSRLNTALNNVKANEGASQTSTTNQSTTNANNNTVASTNTNNNANNSVDLNGTTGASTFGATNSNGQ